MYGEMRLEECPNWKGAATMAPTGSDSGTEQPPQQGDSEGDIRFPWTGNTLGPADLGYLAGAGQTRLLTMAGAAEAGKTSLLAAFYLLLGRGIRPAQTEFAGSLTLEGWENIASNLRWSNTHGPSFPPHTSSGLGRRPGMLHLSLDGQSQRTELLAADAPGEWFTAWSSNKQSAQADGARWLAERSDVFLIIADSQALAGPQRGQARGAVIDLLRRVGGELRGRPSALVWTNSDVTVSTEITTGVREAAKRSLSDHEEFRVSLHAPQGECRQDRGSGIVELLDWVLKTPPKSYVTPGASDVEKTLLQAFGRP
jgi:hypothetical protein